jgi:hypothetical protein
LRGEGFEKEMDKRITFGQLGTTIKSRSAKSRDKKFFSVESDKRILNVEKLALAD